MTSDELARDYLERARTQMIAVDALMRAGGYPGVVRESQDVVELVLKGALRFVGVDPPKRHDVHRAFHEFASRFPVEWQQALERLGSALDQLAADRSPAFYGDEEENIPASELFGEGDARRAVSLATELLDLFTRLLERAR